MSDDKTPGWRNLFKQVSPTGSRVICNPAPMNTDEDFVCLATPGTLRIITEALDERAFAVGGSNIPDGSDPVRAEEGFRSFRHGSVNLIVTDSPEFFRRFNAATAVAKRLNLLDKSDRVALFQAVLYGNAA